MNTRWWYLMQGLPIHETLSSMDSQCHTRPTDSCNARVLKTMEGLPKFVYMLSFVNPDGLSQMNTTWRSEHPGLSWLWDEDCHVRVLCTFNCERVLLVRFHLLVTDDMVPEFGWEPGLPSSRILWRSACLVLGDLDRLTTGVTLHPATEHLVGIILSFWKVNTIIIFCWCYCRFVYFWLVAFIEA